MTGSKKLNIFLPLDEVNQLRLSLDAGAHDVNSYRRSGQGKAMGRWLTIGLTDDKSIQVYRGGLDRRGRRKRNSRPARSSVAALRAPRPELDVNEPWSASASASGVLRRAGAPHAVQITSVFQDDGLPAGYHFFPRGKLGYAVPVGAIGTQAGASPPPRPLEKEDSAPRPRAQTRRARRLNQPRPAPRQPVLPVPLTSCCRARQH